MPEESVSQMPHGNKLVAYQESLISEVLEDILLNHVSVQQALTKIKEIVNHDPDDELKRIEGEFQRTKDIKEGISSLTEFLNSYRSVEKLGNPLKESFTKALKKILSYCVKHRQQLIRSYEFWSTHLVNKVVGMRDAHWLFLFFQQYALKGQFFRFSSETLTHVHPKLSRDNLYLLKKLVREFPTVSYVEEDVSSEEEDISSDVEETTTETVGDSVNQKQDTIDPDGPTETSEENSFFTRELERENEERSSIIRDLQDKLPKKIKPVISEIASVVLSDKQAAILSSPGGYFTSNELFEYQGTGTYKEAYSSLNDYDRKAFAEKSSKSSTQTQDFFRILQDYNLTKDHYDLLKRQTEKMSTGNAISDEKMKDLLQLPIESFVSTLSSLCPPKKAEPKKDFLTVLTSSDHGQIKQSKKEIEARYPEYFTSFLDSFERLYLEDAYRNLAIKYFAEGLNTLDTTNFKNIICKDHRLHVAVFGSKNSGKSEFIHQYNHRISKYYMPWNKPLRFEEPANPDRPVVYSNCVLSKEHKKSFVYEFNFIEMPSRIDVTQDEVSWLTQKNLQAVVVLIEYGSIESFEYASKTIEWLTSRIDPSLICAMITKSDLRPSYARSIGTMTTTGDINKDVLQLEKYDMFCTQQSVKLIKDVILDDKKTRKTPYCEADVIEPYFTEYIVRPHFKKSINLL